MKDQTNRWIIFRIRNLMWEICDPPFLRSHWDHTIATDDAQRGV